MPSPSSSSRKHLLLVEGVDDKHVIHHIRLRHQSLYPVCIDDKNGISQLLDAVGPELIADGVEALGIVVDTNDAPDARWQSIKDRFKEERITLPYAPSHEGTIIHPEGKPRIGIWMMPDNVRTGELEDFVAEMIPGDDPVWPRSQYYIDSIPSDDRKFTSKKALRAKVHAWLAAREDPRRMGQAVRARDLRVDGVLCRQFVEWLTRLYG